MLCSPPGKPRRGLRPEFTRFHRCSASASSEKMLDPAVSCPAGNAGVVRFAARPRTFKKHPSPAYFLNDSRDCSLPSKRRLPRRPPPAHSKGSELFEILPCASRRIVRRLQTGWIDFRARVWIQALAREKHWIAHLLIPASSSCRTRRRRDRALCHPLASGFSLREP